MADHNVCNIDHRQYKQIDAKFLGESHDLGSATV